MQKSFTPKETKTNAPDIYCKGQSCFRCGTFIDECEGTCTVCGTHCKGPNAPCTVCRDTCERCGKPKVRCESRGEIAPLHDEGIGEYIRRLQNYWGNWYELRPQSLQGLFA